MNTDPRYRELARQSAEEAQASARMLGFVLLYMLLFVGSGLLLLSYQFGLGGFCIATIAGGLLLILLVRVAFVLSHRKPQLR